MAYNRNATRPATLRTLAAAIEPQLPHPQVGTSIFPQSLEMEPKHINLLFKGASEILEWAVPNGLVAERITVVFLGSKTWIRMKVNFVGDSRKLWFFNNSGELNCRFHDDFNGPVYTVKDITLWQMFGCDRDNIDSGL